MTESGGAGSPDRPGGFFPVVYGELKQLAPPGERQEDSDGISTTKGTMITEKGEYI
jgi:hypothetical protein